MRNFFFFVAVNVLSGCGTEAVATKKMPPQVTPYFNKFLQEGKSHRALINSYRVDLLVVEFVPAININGGVYLGVCFTNHHEFPSPIYIQLDKTFWDAANPATREALVYHEMGHCILGESHRDELGPNNLPVSVMNASLISGTIYYASPEMHEAYLQELFSHSSY